MLSSTLRDHSTSVASVVCLNPAKRCHLSSRIAYIVTEDQELGRSLQMAIEAYGANATWLRCVEQYLDCKRGEFISCLLVSHKAGNTDCSYLRHILSEAGCPPVIILSESSDIPSCVRLLKEGAHDYLTLPLIAPQLFQAIEAAFEKDRGIRAKQQEMAVLRSRWNSLTTREAEIMRYAVEGFLNKQTAAELNITENTVQVHRGRVMRKMRAESFAELVRMSLKLTD